MIIILFILYNPRSLPLLDPSTRVRYRDPTTKTWKQATIVRPIEAPRSYDLQTAEGTAIRRNRSDLRPTPDVDAVDAGPDTTPSTPDTPTILRRSNRITKPPDRLGW